MGLAKKYDKFEFIRKAIDVHGYKYDYSNVDYKNSRDKIDIICKEHGVFNQMPYNHLQGKGCPKCSKNVLLNIDEFINRSNIKHNSRYKYPDRNYINNVTPIGIECPNHGLFHQTPGNHLTGVGCPKCAGNRKLNMDEFIYLANKKHNFKYEYPDREYRGYDKHINIECPVHGIFSQKVRNHLTGRGCSTCRSSRGEIEIKKILDDKGVKYKQQYVFNDLKHKGVLKFDFAILSDTGNILCLIEYNGQQHYEFKKKFHKDYETFIINQYRDKLKSEYCHKNNIDLYIIRYNDIIEEHMSKILSRIHYLKN